MKNDHHLKADALMVAVTLDAETAQGPDGLIPGLGLRRVVISSNTASCSHPRHDSRRTIYDREGNRPVVTGPSAGGLDLGLSRLVNVYGSSLGQSVAGAATLQFRIGCGGIRPDRSLLPVDRPIRHKSPVKYNPAAIRHSRSATWSASLNRKSFTVTRASGLSARMLAPFH